MSAVLLWAGVGVLGALGALLRWQVDLRSSTRVVNLTGAPVLGLLTGLALPHDASLLLGTAFVGAYTTFSTWMLDVERLAEEGRGARAAIEVVVQLLAGLALVAAGRWAGGQL